MHNCESYIYPYFSSEIVSEKICRSHTAFVSIPEYFGVSLVISFS